MADVSAELKDWSIIPSSNQPADATTIGAGMADNFQQIQATVRAAFAHKGSDLNSAATIDLGANTGFYHDIVGATGPITSFGTVSAGVSKVLQFDSTPTITHNATSMILPGGVSITMTAGSHLMAMSLGGGNWVVPWATGGTSNADEQISIFRFMSSAQISDVVTRTASLDVTAAFTSAAAYAASGRFKIHCPAGTYLVTDEIAINLDRTCLEGDGQQVTVIKFAPTTTGKAAFHLKKTAAAILVQCSVKGVGFDATGNTQGTKSAIRITDGEEIIVDDIAVSNWSSAGKDCIGIQTRGRQTQTFDHLTINADCPISIEDNPNSTIDIDHYNFDNCYLIADSNPIVRIASGVNLTNVSFGGYQAWVQGTHGLYWVDTTSISIGISLSIKNVRTEQGTSATSEMIHIEHNSGLRGLFLENVYGGVDRDGLYLRGVTDVILDGFKYAGTGVAFDADATVQRIRGIGCFWQAGSTKVLAGQKAVWVTPNNPNSGALPPDFYYDELTNAADQVFTEAWFQGISVSIAQDATAVIAPTTFIGMAYFVDNEGGLAQFGLKGTFGNSFEISDPVSLYSVTADTASSYNVYSTGGNYVIQNKRTGTHIVKWFLIGADYTGF